MINRLFYFFELNSAESEGFEPPDLLQSTVFKTAAFDHSASSPLQKYEVEANLQTFYNLLLILIFYVLLII